MSATARLDLLAWPASRVAEGLTVLAEQAGLPLAGNAAASLEAFAPEQLLERDGIERAARALGLDGEPVDAKYPEVAAMLGGAAPALLRDASGTSFWLLLGRVRRGKVTLLSPERERRSVPLRELRRAVCRRLEAPQAAELDAWLSSLGMSGRTRGRALKALLDERLRGETIGDVFMLRLPPSAPFLAQIRAARLHLDAIGLVAMHAALVLLGLGAWWLLGRGALQGTLERGWLWAWVLLSLTALAVRLRSSWQGGALAIGLAKLMKRRLLVGALRLDPSEIRQQGSGALLGRAMEASAIEGLALGAGLGAVLALIELALIVWVLVAGAGGRAQAASLLIMAVAVVFFAWRLHRRSTRWAETRRTITADLVEQMVGHRTRLAQQPPERWHDGEDEALERYLLESRELDRAGIVLGAVTQLWLPIGLVGMAPGFVGTGSAGSLAVAIGGVLLGASALGRISAGASHVAAAVVAWRQVAPLFHAAAADPGSTTLAAWHAETKGNGPLLLARDLMFSYPGRPDPVVRGASVRIDLGDRILVEGPSGGGKSTLVSLLAGLRQPDSGLLLVDGLDRFTLGEDGWRKRVVAAPQYHDNHLLTESLAFNLLMGRCWPPAPGDLRDADETCRALGLGDVLDRMPAGLMQMVGEGGWRLSHGEQSRVFMARALLQGGRLLVLDESFAALDPATLERCLTTVLERAPAVVVVAHP